MSAELVAAAEDLLRMISTVEECETTLVMTVTEGVEDVEVQDAIDHLHYHVQAARRAEGRAAVRGRS